MVRKHNLLKDIFPAKTRVEGVSCSVSIASLQRGHTGLRLCWPTEQGASLGMLPPAPPRPLTPRLTPNPAPRKVSAGLQCKAPARQRWRGVMRFLSFLDFLAPFLFRLSPWEEQQVPVYPEDLGTILPCPTLSSPAAQAPPRKSRLDPRCWVSVGSLLHRRGASCRWSFSRW